MDLKKLKERRKKWDKAVRAALDKLPDGHEVEQGPLSTAVLQAAKAMGLLAAGGGLLMWQKAEEAAEKKIKRHARAKG